MESRKTQLPQDPTAVDWGRGDGTDYKEKKEMGDGETGVGVLLLCACGGMKTHEDYKKLHNG